MKKTLILFVMLLVFTTLLHAINARSDTVSPILRQRMDQIVPYDVDQTIQSFTKTVHGGVQHVVVKSADNRGQIELIQTHLRKVAEQMRKGDFSITEKLHGVDMPGLKQLKVAKLDDIRFKYQALENGGQIHYSSEYPQFVSALHEWFDAQISEHGSSVLPGHDHHHDRPAE